jgi:hypothetical protein
MRRWLSYSLAKELQILNTVQPQRYDHQMPCLLPKDTVVTDLRLDIGRGNEALPCIKKGLA